MKRIFFVFGLICVLGLGSCGSVDSEQSAGSVTQESTEAVSVSAESSRTESQESFAESSYTSEVSESSALEESAETPEELFLEIKVEIYRESTQELLTVFELTAQDVCTEIFDAFDRCFAEVVEKHPHDPAPDKDIKTDYRVAVYLNTFYDSQKENLAYYVDISYPYGYTNDIYRLMHHGGSPFGEYVARLGKPFIDMVDQYVKQYIPV